jgi:hypothetical protein
MCPQFELWNSWFGESQKYDPTSIVVNSSESEKDDVASETAGCGDIVERFVDEVDGGADAAFCVDEVAENAGGASVSQAASPHACVTGAGNRKRSNGAQNADVEVCVARAGAAKSALSNVIKNPVVSSPSVTSSSSGAHSNRSATFDIVYAKCSENKVQSMKDIQASQNQCQLLQQSREHHFQSQKILIEASAAQEERVVRQKIEFEKNVANLLIADTSGGLARNFMTLLREEEARRESLSSSKSEAVAQFAALFALPPS